MALTETELFFWHKLPEIASEHRISTRPEQKGTKAKFEDRFKLEATSDKQCREFIASLREHGEVKNVHWHRDNPLAVFAKKPDAEIPKTHEAGVLFIHGNDPTHYILFSGKYGTTMRRIYGILSVRKGTGSKYVLGEKNIHMTARIVPKEQVEVSE